MFDFKKELEAAIATFEKLDADENDQVALVLKRYNGMLSEILHGKFLFVVQQSVGLDEKGVTLFVTNLAFVHKDFPQAPQVFALLRKNERPSAEEVRKFISSSIESQSVDSSSPLVFALVTIQRQIEAQQSQQKSKILQSLR